METKQEKTNPHYYGDIVRVIFIGIAVVMLLGMTEMIRILSIHVLFPIVAVVVLGICAGLTSPVKYNFILLNSVVSILGLAIFIYISWFMYKNSMTGFLLILNHIIAVSFLFASYFSVKSLRGYAQRN